jgi:hypothetical protein
MALLRAGFGAVGVVRRQGRGLLRALLPWKFEPAEEASILLMREAAAQAPTRAEWRASSRRVALPCVISRYFAPGRVAPRQAA